jgi:hypothetical protein
MIMKPLLALFAVLAIGLSTAPLNASPLAGDVSRSPAAATSPAFGPQELPPVDGPGL